MCPKKVTSPQFLFSIYMSEIYKDLSGMQAFSGAGALLVLLVEPLLVTKSVLAHSGSSQ